MFTNLRSGLKFEHIDDDPLTDGLHECVFDTISGISIGMHENYHSLLYGISSSLSFFFKQIETVVECVNCYFVWQML